MFYINKKFIYNYSGYFCILVYFFVMYLCIFEPNPDETFQIEAAHQLLISGKYQSSWKIPNDLSLTNYTYLTAWPIGYSYLIYLLMLLKFNVTNSILIIRLTIIILNIFFAQKISRQILKTSFSRFVFNLIFSFIIIVESVSAPELLIMLCVLLVSNYFLIRKDDKLTYLDFFFIGFIMSISLIFKYTSVLYIFSIFIYIILISKNECFYNKIKNIFYYLLPILIIGILIFYKNYLESKNVSTLTNLNSLDKLKFMVGINYFYVFYIVFIDSLQFSRLINQGMSYLFNRTIDYKIFIAIFILFFNYFYFSRFRSFFKNYFKIILSFCGIVILSLIISILFFTKNNEWYPLIEQRYYTPCTPFLLLIYIKPIDYIYDRFSKLKFIYPIFIFFFYLMLSLFFYRRFNNSYTIKNNINLVMDKIKLNINQPKKILVFADENYFPFLPRDGTNQVFHFLDKNFSDKSLLYSNISNNITIYILTSSEPLRKFNNNNYQNEHNKIVDFASKNNFKKIVISPTTFLFSKYIIVKK